MCYKRILPFVVVFHFIFGKVNSLQDTTFINIGVMGSYTTPGKVPFWMRSNQYGSLPLDNLSVSLISSLYKDYSHTKNTLIDWGAAVEGRLNVGKKLNFNLIEGYGKLRIGVFEIRAGRSKDIMGLCDTSLTSGAFAVSGNAPGIPKVEVSILQYYTLPFLGKLFAFKGNYSHGWIGEIKVNMMDNSKTTLKTYLHQKSLYGRFGKPEWKWKLYGGFNHQVFWGNEKQYYGSNYTLSDWECYYYIVTGKPYGTDSIPSSKIGNHIGSIDIAYEYNFKNVGLLAYHQFFYDVGALYHLANLRDGLTGISLVNKHVSDRAFCWNKILAEFFYSINQAGELWSPPTPSGDENYYNSDQYVQGWSYNETGLGNPFVGTRTYIKEDLPADPGDYFINNRVAAFHLGCEGSLYEWKYIVKASYSMNYGTFGTSEVGHTLGKIRYLPMYGIFNRTDQFSSYIEGKKELKNKFNLCIIAAFDLGNLYYNSLGLAVMVSRSF